MVTCSLSLFLGLLPLVAADITVTVSDVPALPFDFSPHATSPLDLLNRSAPEELSARNPYRPTVLMSSFSDFGSDDTGILAEGNVFPSSDGLVRGALMAWAQHQHLVLRPDEIWFEILAQLNFYMTAHAEDIRDLFVDFEGEQQIEIWGFSWRGILATFSEEIQKRVKTDWLRDWILPGFSTSTPNDELTATVLMMGLMQHYFEFSAGIICGIPKVTLLGERDDWVALLAKLDRLDEFGDEPARYARNLRPILSRFVATWDEPEAEETASFWGQIVRAQRHFTCGAGGAREYDVSGWITGFLHWTPTGDLRINPAWYSDEDTDSDPDAVRLDGVVYHRQALEDLPVGYAKVPLKMLDYPCEGQTTTSYLLAGNVAVVRNAPITDSLDSYVTAQPLSAWFMYAPVNASYSTGARYGAFRELEAVAAKMTACNGAGGQTIGGDGFIPFTLNGPV